MFIVTCKGPLHLLRVFRNTELITHPLLDWRLQEVKESPVF